MRQLLIVDEHAGFRRAAQEALEDEGAPGRRGGDRRRALASVDRLRPDVILLDVQLPDMTGSRWRTARLPGAADRVDLESPGERLRQRLTTTSAAGFIPKEDLTGAAIERSSSRRPVTDATAAERDRRRLGIWAVGAEVMWIRATCRRTTSSIWRWERRTSSSGSSPCSTPREPDRPADARRRVPMVHRELSNARVPLAVSLGAFKNLSLPFVVWLFSRTDRPAAEQRSASTSRRSSPGRWCSASSSR